MHSHTVLSGGASSTRNVANLLGTEVDYVPSRDLLTVKR
jgi:hypothetical protein